MPMFSWQGRLPDGTVKTGEIEAQNLTAANLMLKRQQITPLKVKRKQREIVLFKERKVKTKDLAMFTRQFATMITAGLPLVQCLDILGNQQENPGFKKIIIDVKQNVESGSTFSDALRKHPKVFDDLFVNMVESGEVGGVLDTILNRLAVYLEKAEALKAKVKSAMVYPIVVLSVAVIVVGVMMVFVIPTFAEMFKEFGSTLPGPTQFFVNMSNFFRKYVLHMIGVIILLVFAFRWFKSKEKGRLIIDDFSLKMPIFGTVLQKAAVARFTRTLSTMISSGVPILEALSITSRASGNKIVEAAVLNVRKSISEGKSIAEPLEESGIFPPLVVQMVGVGEATGALDQMLSKIADFYEEEVDNAVAALTSLMEPLLIVFLGGVIGGMMIAMYLPIFKLAGSV
jgi:type IV pilus assembly protein PilC